MSPAEVDRRLARIRLLVMDVDGVLTDGGLLLGADGRERRRYALADEDAIRRARALVGLEFALLSAGGSPGVRRHGERLGVEIIRTGAKDKARDFAAIVARRGLRPAAAAYVGDDLVDIGPLRAAGLGFAVRDADPAVKRRAHAVTRARGGAGAAAEICERIIRRQRPAAA